MDATHKKQQAALMVYANIAATYKDAMKAQDGLTIPQERKEAAARAFAIADATARTDKDAPRKDAEAGRAIIEKAYGRSAEDVASILTGRAANFDLPKGFERTNDVDKLVRQGQNMTDDLNAQAYQQRGRVQAVGPGGNYMDHAGQRDEGKEKLIQHMLTIKASIDAQVGRNQIGREQGDFTYQRIHKEVFTRETPKTRPEYAEFEKANSARLGREVGEEVERRYAAQSKTVDKASEREAQAVKLEAEKSERMKIAEALAAKAVGEKLKGQDPAVQQAVMQRIQQGLQQREDAGKLASISIYDKNAAPKTQDADRQRPAPEQQVERTR